MSALAALIRRAFEARRPKVWECMGQVWHDDQCRCDQCLADRDCLNKEA